MAIRNFLRRLFAPRVVAGYDYSIQFQRLEQQVQANRLLAARALIGQIRQHGPQDSLHSSEFQAFSQFGDDGIIQYLIHYADIRPENHAFVEFGVENYRESNTRFLLLNNNWRGLVMDGSETYVQSIRREEIYWRHELTAASHFIDRDNINGLLETYDFTGEIGLLSVDIDGNDYWVWQAITEVQPIIVVVEYNSVFGVEHAVTVPYEPTFRRTAAHSSNLYWGASVAALNRLAETKGYQFVGCNSAGNNAYFVRKDRLGRVRPTTVARGYVESRFRESRSPTGDLTYTSGTDRLALIREMNVYNVDTDRLVKLAELRPAVIASRAA